MKENIKPLTSLRFFAASAVLALHATGFHLIGVSFLNKFQLYQAVSFFYVLSGFIMQHTYRKNANSLSVLKFVAIRFSRLWPMHIVSLAIFLAIPGYFYWATHRVAFPIWVENLALVQTWVPLSDHYFSLNAPSWSISDEMFFYAAFAIICVRAKRAPLLVALAVLAILFTYMSFMAALHLDASFNDGLYAVNPLVRLPEFVAGVVLCEAMSRLRHNSRPFIFWTTLEVVAFLGVSINSLSIPIIARWWHVYVGSGWAYYVATAGGLPSFALLIAVFSVSHGGFARLLSLRLPVILGNISFAIYMVHDPILRFVSMQFPGPILPAKFLCVFGAILLIAALCHYLIEVPTYSRARRFIEKSFRQPTDIATYVLASPPTVASEERHHQTFSA
ncbi:MAG TPA: acyltransferase [Acidocella sp.]|jgi:peptidoglycan/LPS O-acetylase OafA/YrhL|uniref:acyltransferase family protein n=1 Tax=Acidocella sp. TaxID=50710 RepID=UPI002D033E9B|nr:acyltransferase [Acidocella sp.]HVE21497.1 acyltransferase [Acidocella sp.]